MVEFFNNINSQIFTAAVLGIAVALNPCIAAANVSAITYATEGHSRKNIIKRGILYLSGRILAFTLLGILLHFFADKVAIGEWIQNHLGKIIGPAFIIIGLILLKAIHIHIHSEKVLENLKNITLAPFIIGFVVAFAFCPEGAAMYFGTMVPLLSNCSDHSSTIVSLSFAFGSVLPIIPLIIIMSEGSNKLKKFKEEHANLEVWIRRIIAGLFIIAGLLFVFEYYIE